MSSLASSTKSDSSIITLLPILSIIFLGFFCIGIPFAALPHFVRAELGFGNVGIGILLGAQSLMTLLTRHLAGTRADMKGPKTAVLQGLGITILSGLLSLLSLTLPPAAAYALLFVARLVLGLGESLLITGALAWGVGLLDPTRTGRVMAWSGIAMYASIAASAPLSLFIERLYGFSSVMMLTVVAPILALLIAAMTLGTPATSKERMAFYKVIHKVWKPGVGLSLSAVGFASLAGFAVLSFKQKGWEYASLVMTSFGCAFIMARVFFAHTPDQYGGGRVALISAIMEAVGQLLVWLAPSPVIALIGAALTGFGYSLVFPAFGVEAVKKIEPQFKGAALGAYVAFFDLALGVTGPLAGLVAHNFGYAAVYLFGALASLAAAWIAWSMK